MKISGYKILRHITLCCLIGLLVVGCEDLLEQKPLSTGANVLPSDAIQNEQDLFELLNSAYDVMANSYNGNAQNLPNLLSDNLVRPVQQDNYTSVWLRNTSIFNGSVGDVFRQYYIAILRANTVIENLDNVEGLDQATRTQFEAEARFIRALCHFDALRSWAQPFGFTPDDSHAGIAIRNSSEIVNSPRSSVAEVADFILDDIAYAKANLPDFNDVYATKWAAFALEAELRFQQHEYEAAFAIANEILAQAPYTLDPDINRFQHPQASSEAIFYIFSAIRTADNVVDNRNAGFRGNYFRDGNPSLRLTEELFDQLTALGTAEGTRGSMYEELNQDGNISYVTTKFNAEFFNIPVFTLTQIHLIRAESAAEIGQDLTDAIADINTIRERAYGSAINNISLSATAQQVINAARLERRLEFPFTGQRLYDLKRIGSQGEPVTVRGSQWDCPGMVLQFPSTEQTDLFPLNASGGC